MDSNGGPAVDGETQSKTESPAVDSSSASSARPRPGKKPAAKEERTWRSKLWFWFVQIGLGVPYEALCSLRATGRKNIPLEGGGLIVCNHLSHWDVLMIGYVTPRPLNYVARSTLFIPILGPMITSLGGFPIQREGIGAQGVKETLKRVRGGGMVVLFPEGTRSRDGQLVELKSGIAMLAAKTRAPVIPTGIAGTFEAWPRWNRYPKMSPVRIHFGEPISAELVASLDPDALTRLIDTRLRESIALARAGLARDLDLPVYEPTEPPIPLEARG